MNTRMIHAALIIFSTMASAAALGQTPPYPAKPVRLVVPFAPGASNDTLSRATALVMGPMLGQVFVVDNKPGAGAMIGAEYVARAEPDGYTILTVQTSFATNAAVRAKMPYDVFSDFAYIGMMAKSPMIVVVHDPDAGQLGKQLGRQVIAAACAGRTIVQLARSPARQRHQFLD